MAENSKEACSLRVLLRQQRDDKSPLLPSKSDSGSMSVTTAHLLDSAGMLMHLCSVL